MQQSMFTHDIGIVTGSQNFANEYTRLLNESSIQEAQRGYEDSITDRLLSEKRAQDHMFTIRHTLAMLADYAVRNPPSHNHIAAVEELNDSSWKLVLDHMIGGDHPSTGEKIAALTLLAAHKAHFKDKSIDLSDPKWSDDLQALHEALGDEILDAAREARQKHRKEEKQRQPAHEQEETQDLPRIRHGNSKANRLEREILKEKRQQEEVDEGNACGEPDPYLATLRYDRHVSQSRPKRKRAD